MTDDRDAPPPLRHLVLVGTMGSGKTTVGRRVATHLGWPFWDNDDRLTRREGRTAAELATAHGAAALHRTEAEVLLEGLDADGPTVVAAAASALADARVRDRLERGTLVVWLHATPTALADRLTDPGVRPSLGRGPATRAGELQRRRRAIYRAVAHEDIDTTDRGPDEVTDLVLAALAAHRRRGSGAPG